MKLDVRKLENVVMADVMMYDFPDFVDAYVEYAEINGVELTDAQYDEVNEDHSFLQESAYKTLDEAFEHVIGSKVKLVKVCINT